MSKRAVAAVLDLTKSILNCQIGNGFSLFKTGGIFAEKDRSSRGAHFNSIAIGARYVREVSPNVKILIVSLNEYQASGSQSIFYSDQNVLNISIYKQGTCPTLAIEECGRGTGLGHNINIPIPSSTTDNEIVLLFQNLLIPIANEFEPELIYISTSLDSFDSQISSECHGWIVKELSNICDGKLVLVLESIHSTTKFKISNSSSSSSSNLAETEPEAEPEVDSSSNYSNSISSMLKSLVFRSETPFMSHKPSSNESLFNLVKPVVEIQAKYWTCLQRMDDILSKLQPQPEHLETELENLTMKSQEDVKLVIDDEQPMSEDEAIDVD